MQMVSQSCNTIRTPAHHSVQNWLSGHQVPFFSYFFERIPIFSDFSAKFLIFPIFQQFAVEIFISGFFFSGFILFQCGNMCTERAGLWESFSHGVVWVRFSHKSLTNVWRSVDLTSPYPR